jgi:uncharacterized membrane protein YqjE
MFESVRQSAALLLAIGATRLELAATELEEERLRIVERLVLGATTLMLGGLAVTLCVLFVIVLMWDTHRLLTIGAMAGFFVFATLLTTCYVSYLARTEREARAEKVDRMFGLCVTLGYVAVVSVLLAGF